MPAGSRSAEVWPNTTRRPVAATGFAYSGTRVPISSIVVLPPRRHSSAPSVANTAVSSALSIACAVVGKRRVEGKPKSSWMPRATVSQRCVWQFTRPGNTALARPSMRSAAGCCRSITSVGPMATMRSASTTMEELWCTVRAASDVTMVVSRIMSAMRIPPARARAASPGPPHHARGLPIWQGARNGLRAVASSSSGAPAACASADRVEGLAASFNRLGGDENDGEQARIRAAIHPVVDGSALNHDVAGFEMHHGVFQLHVDLSGQHDDVVDRVRAVVARGQAGCELEDAEDGAVRDGRADLAEAGVVRSVVVGREALRGPYVNARCARAADKGVLAELVDVHDGPATGVVAGNDASYLQCHVWPPGSAAEPRRQMVTSVVTEWSLPFRSPFLLARTSRTARASPHHARGLAGGQERGMAYSR